MTKLTKWQLVSGNQDTLSMDLTYKITLLSESRRLILNAVKRGGCDPSVAIAMHQEAQLQPLLIGFRDPEIIRYLGTDAQSCLEIARSRPFGFLICTDRLAEGDGFQLCESMRSVSPATKTLLACTGNQIDRRVFDAHQIDGILLFQEIIEAKGVLQAAILAACSGRRYRSQRIRDVSEKASAFELRDRDYDILHCLAEGMSNREIADALQISEQSAKTYTKRLIGNLSAKNRLHALILGLRYGFTSIR
jgi:DNA-binding NarL/FixJ family response regulator